MGPLWRRPPRALPRQSVGTAFPALPARHGGWRAELPEIAILVVGLNLALDRTHFITELIPGLVQRPREATPIAGGKALNVVRAATGVGGDARLLGFAGGPNGGALRQMIEAESFRARLVETAGDTRCAIIIVEDSGRVTVLNEPGPRISGAEWDAMLVAYDDEVAGVGVVVACGSLPPGVPGDAYAELVRRGHARGALVIVDAARDALAAALAAGPDVVAPNLGEADVLLGNATEEAVEETGGDVPERALAAGLGLVALGAGAAIVTAGRHGVAVVSADERAFLTAPVVTVANPIGAGDSLVGGVATALDAGASLLEAARLGVAAASASVTSRVPADVDGALALRLSARVRRLK